MEHLQRGSIGEKKGATSYNPPNNNNLETNATHKTEFNANDPEVRTNQEKPFELSSCSGTKKSQHLRTRRKKMRNEKNCIPEQNYVKC